MKKKLSIILIILSLILIGVGILLGFLLPKKNPNQEEIDRLTKELAVEGTELKFIKEDEKNYYFEGYYEGSEKVEYKITYHKKDKKFEFISYSDEGGGGI